MLPRSNGATKPSGAFDDLDAHRIEDLEEPAPKGKRQRAASRKWRAERLPPIEEPFAAVSKRVLLSRRLDRHIPARFRLYLYLLMLSRRGTREVKVTNAIAREVGLDRHQKSCALRE